MALTTFVEGRVRLAVKRRFPSDGWLQRVLRMIYTMRALMWLVKVCLVTTECTYKIIEKIVVVIWCDSLGDIHLWEDSIPWYPSHESIEGTADRTKTGTTTECLLLR